MIDLYIGIDPGESNGVAIYDKTNGLRLKTLTFWDLADYIEKRIVIEYKTNAKILPHFYVENPNLNGFIYQQKVTGKNRQEAMRVAQNVGMNKGDAKRIIELIKRHDMIVEEVKPVSTSQKWTSEYFKALTRIEVTTNQHVRDAAKLISRHWLK
jgi:hypothetical protein